MISCIRRIFPYAAALLASCAFLGAQPAPIPVKVVVVAMFEFGADTGDRPGELQYWVERDHLDTVYPLTGGYHPVRMNKDGEMAVLTGQGTAHAAATIMALGLDPRFDFSHAYWIVAGIAGGSPDRISLASADWVRWVVDSDLGYLIDSREMPQDWPTGHLPMRKTKPYEEPVAALDDQVFSLNPALVDWAFQLTHDMQLPDSDHLKDARSHYEGAAAQRPPFVSLGDEVSGSAFWHGKLSDEWARDWMRYFTNNQGQFTTTAMEDTGTLLSLRSLAEAHRVDWNRILILRTVSNFDQQPKGLTAAQSLAQQHIGSYSAFVPALETAYVVGHKAVSEILTHWDKYAAGPISGK